LAVAFFAVALPPFFAAAFFVVFLAMISSVKIGN
jgi:hypothetical protein